MIRRGVALGLASMLIAVGFGAARSEAAEGPRLALVEWRLGSQSLDLIDTDQLGGDPAILFGGDSRLLPAAYPYDGPSWSPDGSAVAVTVATGTRRTRFSSEPRTQIFVAAADGSGVRPVPGTRGGAAPVISPDGSTLAFRLQRRRLRPNGHGGGTVAYDSSSTWMIGLDGAGKRQVTPWRNRLAEVPSSFSPDGKALGATRRIGNGEDEAVAIQLASGETTVLAKHALEPVFSPDGAEVALLRGRSRTVRRPGGRITATLTDLFAMRTDGTGLRRLTSTPNGVELAPSWDPSGQRLAFTRFEDPLSTEGLIGVGDAIVEVNADGSCPRKVLSRRGTVYFGAAWQPGPGREAGPLAC